MMDQLSAFIGLWKGTGEGAYPTIDPFEYQETLRFELDPDRPLLHYEQRTEVLDRPSHWESGFVQQLDTGVIQISNSQSGGRVEVLEGRLEMDGDIIRLQVASTLLGNDPQMVESRRLFEIDGDTMTYTLEMATTTTPTPELQFHLRATLVRSVLKTAD